MTTPSGRLERHPVLVEPLPSADVPFTFDGQPLLAREGEVITSALQAAGITVLGRHPRDQGPQGLFCANGQCSRCLVLADGRAVKGCLAEVRPGMVVRSLQGVHPPLAAATAPPTGYRATAVRRPEVLVLGGGPAGIAAAIELGRAGVDTLLLDDKRTLGGKLTLQTHGFFGSVADCYAGTRGTAIARLLEEEVRQLPSVEIWTEATAVGCFVDRQVGVVHQQQYRLVAPQLLLVATGAREKALVFPGSDLPGVYGAGAFQTLVNRDRVRASQRLFIVGGGNVGLIAAYHALQAGITVVGLVEAGAECGGYQVHEEKIRRLGVPVWTRHTVVRATGDPTLEAVTIARVDGDFRPIPDTERRFPVDTLLLAVGLSPVDELATQAASFGLPLLTAGDAGEIAEASAALFSGKLAGRQAARRLGRQLEIPASWAESVRVMGSRPGPRQRRALPGPTTEEQGPQPLIRCNQSIPCDPCVEACPAGLITKPGGILDLPRYAGGCTGCNRCVVACPGLAITLLRPADAGPPGTARLLLPYELLEESLPPDGVLVTVDDEGRPVGRGRVIRLLRRQARDRRRLLELEVPWAERRLVAGFRIQEPEPGEPLRTPEPPGEDPLVCRCERVGRADLVDAIRAGVRDLNQLKALTRIGMGACGGKTCRELTLRIYREEGVDPATVVLPTLRPLVAEVPLGLLAGLETGEGEEP